MTTFFYQNKRIAALAVLMILAVGISALVSIGRQEDPTITNIFATVVTPYPGADPARVESLVTEQIEDELKSISEIKEVKSTSRTGVSIVQIELAWDLPKARIEQIWSDVRDALTDASKKFPAGVPEPTFDDKRVGAFSAISAIQAAPGADTSQAVLRRYADLLADRIRGLSGTKQVRIYGAPTEEILVTIDPHKITSLGLKVDQVSAAIANADTKVRAGQVRGAKRDFLIQVTGEIKSLERLRNIPVSSSASGQIVRLTDIADVKRAVREPATSLAYVDTRRAILVAAKMEDNRQVDQWMHQIRQLLKGYESELPAGLEHRLLFDQSEYTFERLASVLSNLLLGVLLVVSVLFVTLGWRSALIVAAILPLASLMSIAGLQIVGIPIHQMSIAGLIVALGLLVDSGIVMTDEIRKRLETGEDRFMAVGMSVRRLAVPLLASTATTALAFTPMALLPGPAGDFVGAIAVAVIIMLASSLLLALTITSALAGWLLVANDPGKRTSLLATGFKSQAIASAFSRSLDLALRYPKTAILAAMVLPVIGFGALPTLKEQFFPGVDRNQFYVQVKLPDGTAIARTKQVAKRVEQIVRRQGDVRNVYWVIGESAPAFYYNMLSDQDNESSFAEALVTTTAPRATEAILPTLQRELDRELPQARIIVRGLVQGPPVPAPIEIRVVGQNLDVLRQISEQVRAIMVQVPEVIQARTNLSGGAPKLFVDISEEKTRLAGTDLASIAGQLEALLEGALGGTLIETSEELPVRVRVGTNFRGSIDALRDMNVLASDALGRAAKGLYPGIPLSALGAIRLRPAESPIFRIDGARVGTIQGFVHRNVLPEEALKKIKLKIAESGLVLPAGYHFAYGGDADARAEVLGNLLSVAGMIVALTFAVIVLTFGSYRFSLIAGLVIVLSIGLSGLALAAFLYPFGIMAVIGLIGSIGVSINAAIILITALQKNDNAMAGHKDAIRDVVVAQSRHIISTTVTTFGGFIPLILAGGGFWPPFAMAIAGGVLLSTIVSFYFVPPAVAIAVSRRTGEPTLSVVSAAGSDTDFSAATGDRVATAKAAA